MPSFSQMTNRERLIAAFHLKPTDRLPFSPLMDGYFISSLPNQGLNIDILEAARLIGCDFMERHVAGPNPIYQQVEIRTESTAKGSRLYYDTPIGSIYEERTNSGNTSYISKHLIESIEDAKLFSFIAEHTRYEPQIDVFRKRDQKIGEMGMATLSGNMSPIQELLQALSGVENTVYLMADYPEEMDQLLETMHQRNLRQYQALLEYPCDFIFDYEDTSTTVMSKSMFLNYSFPMINDYADLVHQEGKHFITHMCGKLTGFIDEIAKGRQDGLDSVCPPHTGDLYSWDAKRILGNDKVLIGGIDPPHLSQISKYDTIAMTEEIIRKVENKTGFILSTGDAVPYGTPIENLKVISDLIRELGSSSLTQSPDEAVLKRFLSSCKQ